MLKKYPKYVPNTIRFCQIDFEIKKCVTQLKFKVFKLKKSKGNKSKPQTLLYL